LRREEVSSTQDLARDRLDRFPVVVISPRQTEGRGRTGASWENAPRALAVSVAFIADEGDDRPFSLMAGVAAARAAPQVALKWPNDVMVEDLKVGGILVERSGQEVVAGLGLNLWWPDAPDGIGALSEHDPGPEAHAAIGGLWAAEFLHLVDLEGWPRREYLDRCSTLERHVSWEPGGFGVAVDVAEDGGLVVVTDRARHTIYSGAVRHIGHPLS
jgi:BirA family biotin operon repressor/biotin-[acetyl-CoA-carboxylase] ligase